MGLVPVVVSLSNPVHRLSEEELCQGPQKCIVVIRRTRAPAATAQFQIVLVRGDQRKDSLLCRMYLSNLGKVFEVTLCTMQSQ